MAVIKPVRLDEVWSSENPSGVIYPGYLKVTSGWDLEIPNFQHFNYILAQVSQFANYINVLGIGNWDLNTPYELNSRVQWNNLVWKGLKDSLNVEPGTDNTVWKVADANQLVLDHAALVNNPHVVTKTQVGLSDVVNIDYGVNGKVVAASQADNSTLFASAVKDISTTFATATDLKVPTSLAVKTYITAEKATIQSQINSINTILNDTTLPIGTLLMYNGTGWVDNETLKGFYACTLANAAFGVPDLVGKFVYGGASAGTLGGANTLVLTASNLPAHSHTASAATDAHSHAVTGGSHNHIQGEGHGTSWSTNVMLWGYSTAYSRTDSMAISNTDAVRFAYTSSTSHSHTVGTDTHGHTITVNNSTGGGNAFDNRPAFYTTIFVQKVS